MIKPLKIWTTKELIGNLIGKDIYELEEFVFDVAKDQSSLEEVHNKFVSLKDLQERIQFYTGNKQEPKKCLVIRYRQDCQLLLFEQLFDKYLKSEKSELPWDEWLFDFCFKQIKEAK